MTGARDSGSPDGPDFVSESIRPDAGTFDPGMMTRGLAALPAGFTWRGTHYGIRECLDHVKQSTREGHRPGGERYLRRQQFTVRIDDGRIARIYVERRSGQWYLLTLESGESVNPGDA